MRVRDVLASKGSAVATIGPAGSVTELVASLAERNVGALVVVDEAGALVGIISERDVARALHSHGVAALQLTVTDLMTTSVQTCAPGDEVRTLARTMTEGRFRHMPVLDGGALAGIVSMGDIVKNRIDELETEHDQLMGYISSAQ